MAEVQGVRDIEGATVKVILGGQCMYATGGDDYVRVSGVRARALKLEGDKQLTGDLQRYEEPQ
jgi:hypothetical protein